MSRAWLLPPHYRKNSLFTTTYRNALAYWLINIIIFPAYFICVYQIISAVPRILGEEILVLQTMLWLIVSIPVWATIVVPRHYHVDNTRRLAVNLVGYLIITLWLFALELSMQARLILELIVFAWILVLIYLIGSRWVKAVFGSIISALLIFMLGVMIFGIAGSEISSLDSLPSSTLFSGADMNTTESALRNGYLGFLGLIAMTLAAGPLRLLSRHRAYWLYIVRAARYDLIQARYSPVVGLTNWYNILTRRWLPSILDFNNRRFYITLLLLLGIVISFVELVTSNLADTTQVTIGWLFEIVLSGSFGDTFFSGVTLGSGFASLYLLYYFLNNRSRYIVSEFMVNETDNERKNSPELRAVATLTTSLLTDEMQRIAVLLRMRQIENVYFSPDDNNAFFVTTGIDDKYINQLQQIVSINTPQGRFNPAALVALLERRFSEIHIEGKVQRRTNGKIEIWVHMTYGKNGSLAIEQSLIPENTIIEVDEHSLRPIARLIAIKLFIEMGQVTHLSSTSESFSDLLMGLEASANRNWWRAISYYRRTLNAEETLRGLYGLGHYQLGAALTYQGDWQQGLEHLHTAEQDGPLMPEIRYMLALSLLYLYWSRLDKRRNVFNQIRTHLLTATKLRPGFAEAYQLLGTAYYRRGRQIEVSRTRHRSQPEEVPATNYTKAQQDHNYREAVRFLKKAIRLYDDRDRRQIDVPTLYANTQNSSDRVIQQRMTATHQLADALRGLRRYIEAETYYQTVHVVHPRNLRNLNDLTKSLCLSKNWQRAEEFLWRDVFIHDVAWWDADSSFHMAWVLFGGVIASRRLRAKGKFPFYLVPQLHLTAKNWYDYKTADEKLLAKYPIFQYSEGLKYLDFALHQRPRYITSWRQTNWIDPFSANAKYFSGLSPNGKRVFIRDIVIRLVNEPIMINLLSIEDRQNALIEELAAIHEDALPKWQRRILHTEVLVNIFRLRNLLRNLRTTPDASPLHSLDRVIHARANLRYAKEQNRRLKNTDLRHLAQRNLLWIALRIDSYDLPTYYKSCAQENSHVYLRDLERFVTWKEVVNSAIQQMDSRGSGFKFVYERLQINREHVLNYVKRFQESPRSTGLVWQYARLSLAQALFDDWCRMQQPLQHLNARIVTGSESEGHHEEGPTFTDRWELEIYAETTLLTARVLAEAGCYELLLMVALQASELLDRWSAWWMKCYPSQSRDSSMAYRHLTFSPRITRYHQASIRAWKAYALHQCAFDRVATVRCLSDILRSKILPFKRNADTNTPFLNELYKNTNDYIRCLFVGSHYNKGDDENNKHDTSRREDQSSNRFDYEHILSLMQSEIDVARQHIHQHPLSMYVQALVYHRRDVFPQAIEEYERLIDLVSPYDPKRQIGLESMPQGDYEPDKPLTETSLRARMYYMERVCGRQQFYGIVSLPHIHEQIAACYGQMNNPELRVKHLLEAIRQSPNSDSDVDNFLRMAYQLNIIERYEEAESILEAVQNPLQRLGDAKVSESLYQKPDVLMAIVKTRSKNYAVSMNYCRNSAYNLDLRVKLPTYDMLRAQAVVWHLVQCLKSKIKGTEPKLIHQFTKSFKKVDERLREHSWEESDHSVKTLGEVQRFLFTTQDDEVFEGQNTHFQDLSSVVTRFLDVDWVRFPSNQERPPDLGIFLKNKKADKSGEFDWDLLSKAAVRARIILNPDDRKAFFERLVSTTTEERPDLSHPFQLIMEMHIGMFLSREYSNKLSQFSEICNTLAYNRAETGLRIEHAYYDSAIAVSVMLYLQHSSPRGSIVRHSFERKIAQFLDTFGWVRYRHFHSQMVRVTELAHDNQDTVNPNQAYDTEAADKANQAPIQNHVVPREYDISRLSIAEEYLQRGLRYDRQRAIIHYHLARLYLTRVEALWQRFPQINQADVYGMAPLIDTSITYSFRYLRSAREFDRFNRLHTQLSWLNNRLQMYKIAWEKRQFRGIAGDEKADSPFFRQGGVISDAD